MEVRVTLRYVMALWSESTSMPLRKSEKVGRGENKKTHGGTLGKTGSDSDLQLNAGEAGEWV